MPTRNTRPTILRGLLHQAIIDAHELSVVVILEYELAGAKLGFLTQQNFGAELPLQIFKSGADIRVCVGFRRSRRRGAARAPGGQALDLAHGKPATGRALGFSSMRKRRELDAWRQPC